MLRQSQVNDEIESDDDYQNMLSQLENILMEIVDDLCTLSDEDGSFLFKIENIDKIKLAFIAPNGESWEFNKR